MAQPKRHKFIVEITDMEMGWATKQLGNIIDSAIDRGLYEHGFSSYVANIQVKSFSRVMAAKKGQ